MSPADRKRLQELLETAAQTKDAAAGMIHTTVGERALLHLDAQLLRDQAATLAEEDAAAGREEYERSVMASVFPPHEITLLERLARCNEYQGIGPVLEMLAAVPNSGDEDTTAALDAAADMIGEILYLAMGASGPDSRDLEGLNRHMSEDEAALQLEAGARLRDAHDAVRRALGLKVT